MRSACPNAIGQSEERFIDSMLVDLSFKDLPQGLILFPRFKTLVYSISRDCLVCVISGYFNQIETS